MTFLPLGVKWRGQEFGVKGNVWESVLVLHGTEEIHISSQRGGRKEELMSCGPTYCLTVELMQLAHHSNAKVRLQYICSDPGITG